MARKSGESSSQALQDVRRRRTDRPKERPKGDAASLRETQRCRTIGDEPAEEPSISRQAHVEDIEGGREAQRAQGPADGSCDPNRGEEQNGSTVVSLDRGAIAEDQPPTVPPLFLRHRSQQVAGLFLVERKQR